MNRTDSISFREYYQSMSGGDKGYLLLLCAVFVPLTFKLISPIFILCGLGNYTDIIMPTLTWIGIILSYQRFTHSVKAGNILGYILFAIFYVVSPLFYPNSAAFVSENFHDFILTVVPFFFIGLTFDYERDEKLFYFTAVFGILIQIFWQICQIAGFVDFDVDDRAMSEQMGTAYGFLFSVCYITKSAFDNVRLFDVVLSVLSIIVLLLMGTRGPVVVYLVFVVCYVFFHTKIHNNGMVKKTLFFLIALTLYLFSNPILQGFAKIATNIGLSARVFESFIDDQMFNMEESSFRDIIYKDAFNIIKSGNEFGSGFGYDRIVMGSFRHAHNFELEILLDFGRIGGSIILVLLLWMIVKSYRITRSTNESAFMTVMLTCGLLSLQLSSTWIVHPLFFIFFGYMVSLLQKNRPTIG